MIRVDSSIETVHFKHVDAPTCSVIVLAWRLSAGLVDCLRALSNSVDAPPFEVIIVLNGASPEARYTVAHHVEGAIIVDLDHNVGFGGGCNAGALRARGEYLVLLNDDAEVHPEWMAQLVSAASAGGEKVAAIGSLLLNSDGTVQESGCRVLGHAGTVQFGRDMSVEQAEDAGMLTTRSVDYASGAALLLRRDAFTEVGGFDPLYEPAYFEDVDLCFRLRAAGHDVIVHPAAMATHASGGSTSSDTRFRSFAADRSGTRFYARWTATLEQAPQHEAPLAELCDPTLSSPIADAPATVRDPQPSSEIALDISHNYATELASQLTVAEERLLVEQKLREADHEYIAELKTEAGHLRNRLDGLERGGPIVLLRWRLGILRRRFRLRRELKSLR